MGSRAPGTATFQANASSERRNGEISSRAAGTFAPPGCCCPDPHLRDCLAAGLHSRRHRAVSPYYLAMRVGPTPNGYWPSASGDATVTRRARRRLDGRSARFGAGWLRHAAPTIQQGLTDPAVPFFLKSARGTMPRALYYFGSRRSAPSVHSLAIPSFSISS